MRSALAFNYGLYQLTMVIGPGLGGLIIAALGVGAAYTIDAVSCFAMVFAVIAIAPQPPKGVERARDDPALDRRRLAVRARQPGAARLVCDRPRRDDVRDAARAVRGAGGQRVSRRRDRHGRPVLGGVARRHGRRDHHGLAVAHAEAGAGRDLGRDRVGGGDHACRACIARCGSRPRCSRSPGPPTRVSAVCRTTINQTVTPDHMRGRMSSVFSLVVTSGPRLGDIESGVVAGATSAALLGHVGRIGVPGRSGDRDDRVPGAQALRQRRVDRRGRPQSRVSAAPRRGTP